MMKSSLCVALCLSTALAACGSKEEPSSAGAASAHASAVSSAVGAPHGSASSAHPASAPIASAAPAAPGAAASGPAWAVGVAPRPVTAKPADRVWALAPGSGDQAAFDVFDVDSVQGATLTVVDAAKAKHALTPGAFLTPALAPEAAKIKVGDIVIAPVAGYHPSAAHVVKVEGNKVEFKYAHGEKVLDDSAANVAPIGTGIAPFAYVAIKVGAGYREALVAAIVDDQVFAVDEAGAVHRAAKADVKPLDVSWKDRKKGDKVTVFDETGSAETTIEKVSVTKWVYQVNIGGALKRVPFYAVVDKL